MNWTAVRLEATKYIAPLQHNCPRYLDEIRGVAAGAEVDFVDIVVLNVRTEIAFGLFTEQPNLQVKLDGCTSLGYRAPTGQSFLAQNWDWQVEQTPNLFVCHISQPGIRAPDFSMVTEGGVIGKIGLNANGVGVALNAIRARGVDPSKLPIHLALRAALESTSRQAAIDSLKATGVAGSAHILVADETGSTGLECTSIGIKELEMDDDGIIVHANHLLLDHADVDEPPWLRDSPGRVSRLQDLLQRNVVASSSTSVQTLFTLFTDEEGYPGAINRCQKGESETQTLFTIIMDLGKKSALVSFGRPTEQVEQIELSFN